jgi:hypothetical protein
MVSRETTPGLDIAADVLHSTEGYRRRSRFLIDLPTFLIISNHGTSQRSFSTPQPSNSNSDTDLSTDTLIAATPSESGTPVVVNSRDRNGTIIARPTWDKYPTLLPTTTTVQSQTAPRTRRLRITGNFHQNRHLTLPDRIQKQKMTQMVITTWIAWIQLQLLLPFRHPRSVNHHLIVVITFIIDVIYLVIGVDEQSESSLMDSSMVLKLYK